MAQASPASQDGLGKADFERANLYSGGTSIEQGELAVASTGGSATGTGAVQVHAGTLSGNGTIAGAVTVGDGTTGQAFWRLQGGTGIQATVRLQSSLTFNADAIYTCTFGGKKRMAKTDV